IPAGPVLVLSEVKSRRSRAACWALIPLVSPLRKNRSNPRWRNRLIISDNCNLSGYIRQAKYNFCIIGIPCTERSGARRLAQRRLPLEPGRPGGAADHRRHPLRGGELGADRPFPWRRRAG